MNVLNIPRDDKAVKTAFIPKLDALLSFDYSNIEAKLLAYYLNALGHDSMADYFTNDPNPDLHVRTAMGMYDVEKPEDVTKEQRQYAKTNNFSIIYGGGIPTLIKQGVAKDAKEAIELLRRFHNAWPGIGWESKQRQSDTGTLVWFIKKRLEERGYLTTLWGRHLHPRSLHSAPNALIQGCCADLMKWAMIQVHDWLKEQDMQSHMINVVYDDIVMDVATDEIDILAKKVPLLMTYQPIEDVVPITPEPEISYTNWANKEPYETSTTE